MVAKPAQQRARCRALQSFFESPPPRSFEDAPAEVKGYWDEYVGSARLGWFITAGIVLVPYLGFAVVQLIAFVRGRALASDVSKELLPLGVGLAMFVLLPLWLFFRSMRRRNEHRMLGLARGEAAWLVPDRAQAIMHTFGDGPEVPVWETWLRVSDHAGRPMLRALLPRSDGQPRPDRVFVVEAPEGHCLVLWDPGPACQLLTAAERRST